MRPRVVQLDTQKSTLRVRGMREDAQTRNHGVLVDSELKPRRLAILTNKRRLGVEEGDARRRTGTQIRRVSLCRPGGAAVD